MKLTRRAILAGIAGGTARAVGVGVGRASEAVPEVPETLTFLGHAGFALSWASGSALIDPWFTGNPAFPPGWNPPPDLRAILVTHGHVDHLDSRIADWLVPGIRLIASTPVAEHVREKSGRPIDIVEMNKDGSVEIDGATITMTHAVHASWVRDAKARIAGSHEAAGFVLRLPSGRAVYHAGDTAAFADMVLIGEIHRPYVALLPIGGRHTMSPREAALAMRMLKSAVVIPMHYGTFDFLAGSPAHFERELHDAGLKCRMRTARPGERFALEAL